MKCTKVVLLLKAVNGAWWEDLNPWAPKSWTGRKGASLGPEYEPGQAITVGPGEGEGPS